MLSALVSLPRGTTRTRLLKELRRLGVKVQELSDLPVKLGTMDVDFVVVGTEEDATRHLLKRLGAKGARLPIIMVETSGSLHESSEYENYMWCLHRPVRSCLIRTYVQSIMDRKKLSARLARVVAASKNTHTVDDMWFDVFKRLKDISRK